MQYLLEIGLEDMPAHVVTPSINQLADKTAKYLKDAKLDFGSITKLATPRRLTMIINDVAAKTADIAEDVKGPAKKIALDKDGNWSKAAMGFTRGQGMTVDDIIFKDIKGTEYVYLHKEIAGKPAAEILSGLIDVVKSLNFPTRMHWGSYDFEFIRPVHWIVSLLDDQIVPMQLLDVKAGRTTQGHRFLGHETTINTPADYVEALRAQKVLVDPTERKELIRKQIAAIADANNWQVDPDADLLEEVNNLVEWPTAFTGKFDEKYLAIPEEVLITSMKDNQRYFYARDTDGKMVNVFIGVRNGNSEHMDNVIRGNEKVLTARLEDAAFFYAEDQKKSIADYVLKLQNVSFHEKLGSLAAKMSRVQTISAILAPSFDLTDGEKKDLQRAASIYKFDLVTGMVGEFAELQGTMAAHYASIMGENETVAKALGEQYMPISAEGDLPASKVGTVLAMADKFDTLLSFFAVDMIPSGSNDPYALRRQAYGIVRMLDHAQVSLPLDLLQVLIASQLTAAKQNADLDYTKNSAQVTAFIQDRVRQLLQLRKVRHDIIDAVVAMPVADVTAEIAAAATLTANADKDDFKDHMEALTRVVRIAKKNPVDGDVNTDLFDNDSEPALHAAIDALDPHADLDTLFAQLSAMTATINAYFDATMVMADDDAVRTNRLAELNRLAKITNRFGDLTVVIAK
jgi:glycyl-tRNA synthetase beta chain